MRQNVLERMEAMDAKRKMANFRVKMQQDYEFKKSYAYPARKFCAAKMCNLIKSISLCHFIGIITTVSEQ